MIENSFLSFINNKCVHTTYLLILVHKRYMKCESTFVFYEYTQELATVGNDETLQSTFFQFIDLNIITNWNNLSSKYNLIVMFGAVNVQNDFKANFFILLCNTNLQAFFGVKLKGWLEIVYRKPSEICDEKELKFD